MSLIGKTLLLRFTSGLEVRAHYLSTSEMAWEGLAGLAEGRTATEQVHLHEVAPGVFFVSWMEADATSVSNVIDLTKRMVLSYATFDTPDGRQGAFDTGTVEIES